MKELKLKYSKYIPFKGFYAITLFGYIIRREQYRNKPISVTTMNHEGIHMCQAEDFCKGFIGYIIFYLLYIIEYILRLIASIFTKINPYLALSFEQEAYCNQTNLEYQDTRKRFAWTKYLFKSWK